MATSTLRDESREVDQLCLSVATTKREMATTELAATEAHAHLAAKAYVMRTSPRWTH
jgi:hypothetical protein